MKRTDWSNTGKQKITILTLLVKPQKFVRKERNHRVESRETLLNTNVTT